MIGFRTVIANAKRVMGFKRSVSYYGSDPTSNDLHSSTSQPASTPNGPIEPGAVHY